MLRSGKRKSSVDFEISQNKLNKHNHIIKGSMTVTEYLAFLYPFLMKVYDDNSKKKKNVEHIAYTNDNVFYKGGTSSMTVRTEERGTPSNFLLHIEIHPRKPSETAPFKWSHAYSWNGGWFKTHYKMLCLFELHGNLN